MAQQLYDILPSNPFGRGTTSSTISSDPCSRAWCSGTTGTKTLTVGDKNGTFSDGDLVMIHQSRATSDIDNWEVNEISSGASGTSWTLENNLSRTYTTQTGSNNAQRAQVATIPEYVNLTVNSFTGAGWKATENYNAFGWGGITVVAVRGVCAINGTPNLNGKNGWATTQDHNVASVSSWYTHSSVVGGGFRPGWNSTDGSIASSGEGFATDNYAWETKDRNGLCGGGGGGPEGAGSNPGGGGGHGANGPAGGGNGGLGGLAVGNISLSRLWFGGAGGGGHSADSSRTAGSGGGGGGIWVIWAKQLIVNGGLTTIGGNGADGDGSNKADGAGGAGGAILINCQTATLGSNKILATGGTAPEWGGAVGRIRVNYSNALIGSWATNPAASTNRDSKLRIPAGMMQMIG